MSGADRAAVGAGFPPRVDSSGRDISGLVSQSDLSPAELQRYLQRADPDGYQHFLDTGQWPQDVQIPRDASSLAPDGRIDWGQAPGDGYARDAAGDPIKEPYAPQEGEIVDRYGSADGRFTSPVSDVGPYGYEQRSLPYVEDPAQYHWYEVTGDFSDIKSHYDSAPGDVKTAIDKTMDDRNYTWADITAWKGSIAEAFGHSGGGVKIELPFSAQILERMGMLKELP